MKTPIALFALVLTAGAAELPLPPGAVMAVHIGRPDTVLRVASRSGVKLPDLPTTAHHKLASLDYAVYPGDRSVLVLETVSAEALDMVEPFVQLAAKKNYTTRIGNLMVVAPSAEFVRPGLASSPLYQQAKKAAAPDATGWAFINMAMINQSPKMQKSLADSGSWMEVLISGAIKESLRNARWLSLSLSVEDGKLSLHTASDGKLDPAGMGAFSQPGETGVLPNLTVPGQLAGVSLWRDLGKFYAARDKLFPEKTSGGILFENFMEIFFTGRDLNAEVFSRFHPEIRLVAARQQYDPRIGTPVQQYPAVALVVRVDQAEEFGEMLEEAWQKAIGLQNFTRGQQALPGLIFDRAAHGGVPFTYCYYSARNEKDREHLPARFNLRPALVRAGPYMILSSTDGLAADLIDAVNREDGRVPANPSQVRTLIEISSGAEIAALLKTNRDEMVRQSVKDSGKKIGEAEAEFDRNLALLKLIASARLSLGVGSGDLELRLK